MQFDVTPDKVKTDDGHWYNFCDGLKHCCEKEATCRLYAQTAKKHGRWDLTQSELDAEDSSGSFWFNSLDDLGWFVKKGSRWTPTATYFGKLISCGKVLATAEG